MHARELHVRDAFEFVPPTFPDHRGLFVAPFQQPSFVEARGHRLHVAQTNHSVSARGTIRGVHFTDTPPGQAKYVYCPRGVLLDVVVDLRQGSPTYGTWDAVTLGTTEFKAVYVAEGIGHAFVALAEDTVLAYLCSTSYNPSAEHSINPRDPALALPWPADLDPILSEKDAEAPTLAKAKAEGLLPRYDDCLAHYSSLRAH